MTRRLLDALPTVLTFAVLLLVSFTASAFAADQALPSDANAQDLLNPLWQAFAHGDYLFAGCIAVMVAVGLIKRYGANWEWAHTDAGSASLVLASSFAATIGAHLGNHEAPSLTMAWSAFKIAAGAAGGYTLIKHLLVEPLMKRFGNKLPKWASPLLSVVMWLFERKAKSDGGKGVADAEKAGQDAVDAKPSQGVEGVLGKPVEVQ